MYNRITVDLREIIITTMAGIYILSLFFIVTAYVTLLNIREDWVGSVTFLFIFFVFLYFVLRGLLDYKQKQKSIENRIPSEDPRRIS